MSDRAGDLRCEDLVKNYERSGIVIPVLRGVNLHVRAGEFLTIVGASGSGKSTLLHCLGGLDRPTGGRVFIADQQLDGLPDENLARIRNREVGFVFQFHHLLPEFSALENVMLPGLIARRPTGEVRKRATELLDRVGLSHRLEHHPAEMSGGEQQRVAVARALINEPAVLLLDEPTGNLDRKASDSVYELLVALNREIRLTTVMVTHNEHLTGLAERIQTLVDGILVNPSTNPDVE